MVGAFKIWFTTIVVAVCTAESISVAPLVTTTDVIIFVGVGGCDSDDPTCSVDNQNSLDKIYTCSLNASGVFSILNVTE
jgi:hypothetical protein